jgi:hypothetical protein
MTQSTIIPGIDDKRARKARLTESQLTLLEIAATCEPPFFVYWLRNDASLGRLAKRGLITQTDKIMPGGSYGSYEATPAGRALWERIKNDD